MTVFALIIAGFFVVKPASAGEAAIPVPIENSAVINAPINEVWAAWTTPEGVPTFLGFAADVHPQPRGVFRVVFAPEKSTPLERGNDGIVVAVEHQRMLSVTWMTPMHMPNLKGNSTSLVLYFDQIDDGRRTLVRLINSGYGSGPEWQAAYQYNIKGWDRVLSALEYRFETGPIDWTWAMAELKSKGVFPWWREVRGRSNLP